MRRRILWEVPPAGISALILNHGHRTKYLMLAIPLVSLSPSVITNKKISMPMKRVKKFSVSVVFVVFQYSSSDSVCEVKRKSFKACNTSNSLNTFSNGNRTVQLTQPGKRYFISGNKLYCLGGMKLQVIVEGDASSPISSPEAQPEGNLPRTSLKAKNAPSDFSNSSEFSYGRRGSLLVAFLGFMATILWVV